MTTYYAKTGDVGSSVTGQSLLDGDGNGALLAGATIRFLMATVDLTIVIAADADIVDADTGTVSYTWVEGDLDTPGYYLAEWEVTYGGAGGVETFPADGYISVIIRADLDVDAS